MKRALVIDESRYARPHERALNAHEGFHAISTTNIADATRILEEHRSTPFDWVLIRKNMDLDSSTDYNRDIRDSGVDLLQRIKEGKFGDYSNVRLALVTNSVNRLGDILHGKSDEFEENVARLKDNMERFPDVDCMAPEAVSIYIKDVVTGGPSRDWTLPALRAYTPKTEVAEGEVQGEPLSSESKDILR